MKPVKLGVLGVSGHFILRCLRPLKESGLIEVYAIASRDGLKAKETSQTYGIPVSYSSYEELLKDKSVEMVYIPLPNHLHAQWIKKSADAGKHILCEKPIALNAPEAGDAITYAQKKGVLVMEAFMYRFHPQWRAVRDLVRYREVGAIQSVQTFFGYNNTDSHNIRNIKEAGGGALLDIGCYAVSVPRYIYSSEPKRVFCWIERDQKFGTDVMVSGILDFGSSRAEFTISTQTHSCQTVQINGTGGVINVEIPFNMPYDIPARISVTTGNGTRIVETDPSDQYGIQFESFAIAVRGEKTELTAPEDAVLNMKVIDALFRSSEKGGWEEVE